METKRTKYSTVPLRNFSKRDNKYVNCT